MAQFDAAMYTTSLDPSSLTPAQRARAEALAAELQGGGGNKASVEMSEEDLHSAVLPAGTSGGGGGATGAAGDSEDTFTDAAVARRIAARGGQ